MEQILSNSPNEFSRHCSEESTLRIGHRNELVCAVVLLLLLIRIPTPAVVRATPSHPKCADHGLSHEIVEMVVMMAGLHSVPLPLINDCREDDAASRPGR